MAVDASTIKRETGRQVAGSSAVAWLLGCVLLWIVVFPYYLIKRGNHSAGTSMPAAERTSGCFCGACGARDADRHELLPGVRAAAAHDRGLGGQQLDLGKAGVGCVRGRAGPA